MGMHTHVFGDMGVNLTVKTYVQLMTVIFFCQMSAVSALALWQSIHTRTHTHEWQACGECGTQYGVISLAATEAQFTMDVTIK